MANGNISVSLTEVMKKIAEIQEDLRRINIVLASIDEEKPDQKGDLPTDHACDTINPWKAPD